MPSSRPDQKPMALSLVFSESSHGGTRYLKCDLRIVIDEQDPYDPSRRYHYFDSYSHAGERFISLGAQSHVGGDWTHSDGFYGWEHFRIGAMQDIHERDAENALKALKSLRRKLDAMEELEGRPSNFGVFVNRIARALKCKRIFSRGYGADRSENTHSLAGIVAEIVYAEKHWRESNTPARPQLALAAAENVQ